MKPQDAEGRSSQRPPDQASSSSTFSLHALAERRQEHWRSLPEAWPEARDEVRLLTTLLNGHDDDIIYGLAHKAPKRGYFDGSGGLWEDRRIRRPKSYPPAPSKTIDSLMRENCVHLSGGRRRAWVEGKKSARAFDGGGNLLTAQYQEADETKWRQLSTHPTVIDYLSDDGTHADFHELSGGDHDRVFLVYYSLRPRFSLGEHAVALKSGRPPKWLRKARDEVDGIIQALHRHGIPQTEIARLFGCSRKTIQRRLSETVPQFPKGIGANTLPTPLAARIDAHLDEQDRSLRRIENTLAALLDQTDSTLDGLTDRFPELEEDVHRVRNTLSLVELDEEAAA
jgi:hypothetical protein